MRRRRAAQRAQRRAPRQAQGGLPRWAAGLALLAILLLTFGLRIYRLDFQSLWADEGNSAFMTGRTFTQILDAAAGDIHPPLYYLVLRVWSAGAGTSEFALRFPSAAFGLLLVAALYALGARIFSLRVGLLAGFLGALSPPLVYYSQEARMYGLVVLAAALSLYWFWRLLSGGGRGVWLGYLVGNAVGLYAHYSFLAVLLVENLAFVLWRWPFDRLRTAPFDSLREGRFWRHRSALGGWLRWLAAQAALLLLFLPWLARAWDQLQIWQAGGEPTETGELMSRLFGFWAFGPAAKMAGPEPWWLVAGLVGAALLPLLAFPAWRAGTALVVFYLAVPTAGLLALSASRGLSDPKQLLILAPAFLLALAVGVASLGRMVARGPSLWGGVVAAGLALAVAGALLGPLGALYFDTALARDDYRGLVRLIEAQAGPGEGIILNAPGQAEVFSYYYRGGLARYPLPGHRPPDRAATEAELARISTAHPNLWLVLWGDRQADPQGILLGWLNANALRGPSRWFGNVLLVRYRQGLAAGEHKPLNLPFASGVELVGYRLEEGPAEPGQTLGLSLLWRSSGPLPLRYKVFVHLRDRGGRTFAQHDGEPQGGSRPTTAWKPGETIADGHGLALAWGAPPGSYDIVVGLYAAESGQRLELLSPRPQDEATAVALAQITVRKPAFFPPPQVLSPQHSLRAVLGPLELVGYDLTRRGEEAPRQSFAPGEVAQLVLYWRARERPAADLPVAGRLVDNGGRAVWDEVGFPADYPTSDWEAGELVRDERWIPLFLAPGRYRLVVALEGGKPQEIGSLEITPR